MLPGLRFDAHGSIVIKSKSIEKILAVAEELPINETIVPGSEEFARIIREWELLASRLSLRERFPHAISDAFSDTLAANDGRKQGNEKRPPFSRHVEAFIKWYQLYGTGVLAEADRSYFEEFDEILAWIQDIKGSWMDRHMDVSYFAQKMELACYGRRFFITDQGSMGLALSHAREGDELVFFPGGLYPFVIRGNDDGTYKLVGDCFLYDLNVIELFKDAKREIKEFVLR